MANLQPDSVSYAGLCFGQETGYLINGLGLRCLITTEKQNSDAQIPLNFLVVGCQRCGTTWLDAALRDHPQVYLPPQKQTYFFDRTFDLGVPWYMEQFAGVTDSHQAVGEVATGYCLPDAIPRMVRALPDVRLLMIMRHPVDRAYSNYQARWAEQGWSSFAQAIEQDDDLLARSRYSEQIEKLLEYYPQERIKLLFYDDLAFDDRSFVREIYQYIGIDPEHKPAVIGQMKNAAMFPLIRSAAKRLGVAPLLGAISKSSVGTAVRKAHKRSGKRGYEPMSPAMRQELLEYFKPYNKRLAEIADRDLSDWDV